MKFERGIWASSWAPAECSLHLTGSTGSLRAAPGKISKRILTPHMSESMIPKELCFGRQPERVRNGPAHKQPSSQISLEPHGT